MIWILCVTIVALIGIDQGIKYWAVHSLQPVGSMPFLHIGDWNIMQLTYLENGGAAFGSFSGKRLFLMLLTAVMVIVAIVAMVRYRKKSLLLSTSLCLVIAGGIGNFIDRMFRDGRVVDYLDVKLFRFAVFNFADCCVVIGAFLFAFYIIFLSEKKKEVSEDCHAE